MHLSRVRLIVASFLFASACAAATDDESIPGELLAVSAPDTPLKPLLNSSDGMKSSLLVDLDGLVARREDVARLVDNAARTTNVAEPACIAAKASGGGCCEFGDNCVRVVSTGQRGCCPIGKTCIGGGGGGGGGSSCVTPSYSPCPNDNFCCPPGDICYRDSNNGRRCRSPGSPSVSIPGTTFRPTTTSNLIPTSTPLFTSAAGGGAGLVPTVYPSPTPIAGTRNVVVYATDTRILWAGSAWVLGPSSCNATAQSKKTTSVGHSLSFTVSSAQSVYLTLSARNVEYDISINGRSTSYHKTTTLDDCKLTWSSGIITTAVTLITITVRGPAAPLFNGRRQLPSDWSFEFHNFLTTMSNSAATGASGGDQPNFPGASSAAIGLRAHSVLYAGLVATFVVFFGFF